MQQRVAQVAKTKTRTKNGLTRQQMAELFGVNAQQWDRRFRPYLPDDFVLQSGTGKTALFAPASVRAILDAMLEEANERAKLNSDDALLLDGGSNDPGLQRLRLAKAKLAELELDEKRGGLVRADSASRILQVVASKIRRLGERLTRKHGPDVADAIDRALDESMTELERTLGSGD